MKQTTILILAAGIMMLGACKEKKQTDENILTTDFVPPRPQEPIKMPATESHEEVTWDGASYGVQIRREPVDSLPMVTSDYGQKYVDNSVQVYITDRDGTPVFRHTFTKGSFRAYIDKDYQRNSLLSGIYFKGVTKQTLDFSVSISHPEMSDGDDVPLKLSVDRQGGVSISLDEEDFDVAPQ